MLIVLSMIGESLVGEPVRERLGMDEADGERFGTGC